MSISRWIKVESGRKGRSKSQRNVSRWTRPSIIESCAMCPLVPVIYRPFPSFLFCCLFLNNAPASPNPHHLDILPLDAAYVRPPPWQGWPQWTDVPIWNKLSVSVLLVFGGSEQWDIDKCLESGHFLSRNKPLDTGHTWTAVFSGIFLENSGWLLMEFLILNIMNRQIIWFLTGRNWLCRIGLTFIVINGHKGFAFPFNHILLHTDTRTRISINEKREKQTCRKSLQGDSLRILTAPFR